MTPPAARVITDDAAVAAEHDKAEDVEDGALLLQQLFRLSRLASLESAAHEDLHRVLEPQRAKRGRLVAARTQLQQHPHGGWLVRRGCPQVARAFRGRADR